MSSHTRAGLSLHFRVQYHTSFGQNLFLVGNQEELGNWQTPVRMNFEGVDNYWVCDVTLPISDQYRMLHYKYILSTNGETKESEHTLKLSPILEPAEIEICDSFRWTDNSVCVDVVMRRELHSRQAPPTVNISKYNGVPVYFSVLCPHVRRNQTLKVVGSVPELGNWNPSMALELNDSEFPTWRGTRTFSEDSLRFEFKFIIVGVDGSVTWESGANRSCSGLSVGHSEPTVLVLSEYYVCPTAESPKKAGISCPLFTLKTDVSCGIEQDANVFSSTGNSFVLPMRTCFEAMSARVLVPNALNLTHKGMCSVNLDCCDCDFEFVFGEGKVCRVHPFLAEFLSPKIARLRRCDISYSVYRFKDSEMFDVFESLVSRLRSGNALWVDKSNFTPLLCISQELENDRLLSSLLRMIRTESLSLGEAILLLRVGIEFGTAFSDQFGDLRDFIASHFYEIEKEILDDLELETTQFLLSSPSLQIEDEDSLYDFVRSRSQNDLSFTSLFEFIYFDYLSADRIENFSSFVGANFIENINSSIWTKICRRLIRESNPKRRHPRLYWTASEFVCDPSNKMNGIVAHLTRECGENVHNRGIVAITERSSIKSVKNAVDFGGIAAFLSHSHKDPWICYDFKDQRVIPTSYTVQVPAWCTLKSWIIQVTNDEKQRSWTVIDHRHKYFLEDHKGPETFDITHVPREGFRFFRLKQIEMGRYHSGLPVRSLEIFGTLVTLPDCKT